MAWDSFNWGGSDYGQPGPWSLTALLNKDKKDDELDILRRYRQAMDGTTSETPADVMKDARRKGFNQSLIALGLGVAKGDVVGGMAAASDAYQQGMSGRLREYASERDARMAKEQEKFNLAMAEARLTKEKEESDRAASSRESFLAKHPEFAGYTDQALNAAMSSEAQAQAARAVPDWQARPGIDKQGRPILRRWNQLGNEEYIRDGFTIPGSEVANEITPQQEFDARQANTKFDNALNRERLLDSQESRAERERMRREQEQADIDQARAAGLLVDPKMAKRANDAFKSNMASLQTALNIAHGQARMGQPATISITNFAEGDGVKVEKDEQGTPVSLSINGKSIPIQNGAIRLDALDSTDLEEAARAKTQRQIGRMLMTSSSDKAPPSIGGNEAGGAGLSSMPEKRYDLVSSHGDKPDVAAAIEEARADFNTYAGSVQDPGMKSIAWKQAVKERLMSLGLSAEEIAAILAKLPAP